MKLSDLYGKEVVSADKSRRGWVRAVLGNGSLPQFLQCFDEDEREFEIDFKNVIKTGEKIIYDDAEKRRKSAKGMRLGLPAYGTDGAFLGHLTDMVSAKDGTFYYVIGKKKYRSEFVAAGDALIVRAPRTLKQSVVTDGGEVVLKRGSALDGEALKKAEEAGEYFQAQMKTI